MARTHPRTRRLLDTYAFPGFRPQAAVRGVFGDPKAHRQLASALKKTVCGGCGQAQFGWYDRKSPIKGDGGN